MPEADPEADPDARSEEGPEAGLVPDGRSGARVASGAGPLRIPLSFMSVPSPLRP
ncbi:hypothetical protein ACF1HJ_14575 [Streptomyces sp. NPDC013978]|uniref:hypothetical protein n=1 Tax=Streptomyces sp. NPDC013978 TaxID=3364869 RepID=UPI0036FE6175